MRPEDSSFPRNLDLRYGQSWRAGKKVLVDKERVERNAREKVIHAFLAAQMTDPRAMQNVLKEGITG